MLGDSGRGGSGAAALAAGAGAVACRQQAHHAGPPPPLSFCVVCCDQLELLRHAEFLGVLEGRDRGACNSIGREKGLASNFWTC